jgi:regulator of protease activity HflC (stomatin/prohibitin superfamily)
MPTKGNLMKFIFLLLCLTTLASCGFETVDNGNRGLLVSYGKVDEKVLTEGFHTYNPLTTDLVEINVKSQQYTGSLIAGSKDTQNITIKYSFNLNPKTGSLVNLYREFGPGFFDSVVPNRVTSRIKNHIGKYEATEAMAKRGSIATEIEKDLAEVLGKMGFEFFGLELVDIDYEPEFAKAIQDKVIAVQRGIEAQNNTTRIREESEQKVIEARADAEAMRIKSAALSANANLVQYEAVQKWNGVLPVTMMGQSVPFINLK